MAWKQFDSFSAVSLKNQITSEKLWLLFFYFMGKKYCVSVSHTHCQRVRDSQKASTVLSRV